MKRLLIAIAAVSTFTAYCQSVKFEIKFNPNKTYLTQLTTTSQNEVSFSGDEAVLAQIRASGMKLPLVTSNSMEVETVATMGSPRDDKSFPARIVYNKMRTTAKMNDKETQQDNPIAGMIIEGSYDKDNKFHVDTMISAAVNDQMKTMIRTMLENVQQQIKFPDKPMKKGDTFDQQVPLTIPVPGLNPVKMIVNTTYTLKEILKDKAMFDIVQALSLDMSASQGDVHATGSGKGTSEFDIANSTLTRFETDMAMDLEMKVDKMVVGVKGNTKSIQVITVQ